MQILIFVNADMNFRKSDKRAIRSSHQTSVIVALSNDCSTKFRKVGEFALWPQVRPTRFDCPYSVYIFNVAIV